MRDPLNCRDVEDSVGAILIRNIWPTLEYKEEYTNMKSRFIRKRLIVYNDLSGLGDIKGKDYLIELFNSHYPVIPTINNIKDFSRLPESEFYFIKPKHGGSSINTKKLTKSQLVKKNLAGFVIQPYVDYEHEISFYFIDGQLQYVLYAPNKNYRWFLKEFKPSKSDVKFANLFVNWNTMKYGLQRIDACRMKNGKLLLMEVEDICPYLSLLDVDKCLRNKLVKNLIKSISKNCFSPHQLLTRS